MTLHNGAVFLAIPIPKRGTGCDTTGEAFSWLWRTIACRRAFYFVYCGCTPRVEDCLDDHDYNKFVKRTANPLRGPAKLGGRKIEGGRFVSFV